MGAHSSRKQKRIVLGVGYAGQNDCCAGICLYKEYDKDWFGGMAGTKKELSNLSRIPKSKLVRIVLEVLPAESQSVFMLAGNKPAQKEK